VFKGNAFKFTNNKKLSNACPTPTCFKDLFNILISGSSQMLRN